MSKMWSLWKFPKIDNLLQIKLVFSSLGIKSNQYGYTCILYKMKGSIFVGIFPEYLPVESEIPLFTWAGDDATFIQWTKLPRWNHNL